MTRVTRRQFGTTTASALLATAASARRVAGANDRVASGSSASATGATRSSMHSVAHKDAEIVAVCDIYEPYVDLCREQEPVASRRGT